MLVDLEVLGRETLLPESLIPGFLPDVETVSGLIHTWLGRPPQIGDTIEAPELSNIKFTVLDIDGLAVARAKVEYPAEKAKTED